VVGVRSIRVNITGVDDEEKLGRLSR
jgi:hypothetical protein